MNKRNPLIEALKRQEWTKKDNHGPYFVFHYEVFYPPYPHKSEQWSEGFLKEQKGQF